MVGERSQRPRARDFMSGNVRTVYQHQNVSHAVETMAENNIGSVVVLDNSGPCGVFTERDLLARVVLRGRNPESIIMAEVLSPAFPSIGVDATVDEAAAAMIKKKARLMVFEGPELVGIVTPTDIVRTMSALEETHDISNAVSRRIVSALRTTPLIEAVRAMHDKRVGSVIVADGVRPKGIFTERDLLKRVLVPRLALTKTLGEAMSSPLITAEYGAGSRDVAKIMATNRIKRLPLFSDDRMVGIVTARDLVESLAVSSLAAPRL